MVSLRKRMASGQVLETLVATHFHDEIQLHDLCDHGTTPAQNLVKNNFDMFSNLYKIGEQSPVTE